MKKILITGAAGFLGSHLCDRFISEGFNVIGMDNFITGDKKNLEHLLGLDNFEFVAHHVTNFIELRGRLDYILHFVKNKFSQKAVQINLYRNSKNNDNFSFLLFLRTYICINK